MPPNFSRSEKLRINERKAKYNLHKNDATIAGYVAIMDLKKDLLYLDLNLNTAGELELHQRVNSLSGRAIDVNQTLVV